MNMDTLGVTVETETESMGPEKRSNPYLSYISTRTPQSLIVCK